MTLASTAEGLSRLITPNRPSADFKAEDVERLRALIEGWTGSIQLKSRVLGWFARLGDTGASHDMKLLRHSGVLSEANVDAWNRVRNAVMHGELVSPWSTRKEDEQILQLADLMHRLTFALLPTLEEDRMR